MSWFLSPHEVDVLRSCQLSVFSFQLDQKLCVPAPSLMHVQQVATGEDYTSRGRSYAFCPLVATLRSFCGSICETVHHQGHEVTRRKCLRLNAFVILPVQTST